MFNPNQAHIMKPTRPDPEAISVEAEKAAFLYDTIIQACPYPWGSLAAQLFTQAFDAAKEAMRESYTPAPKVASQNINKLVGKYEPQAGAYYRNDGNPHVPSRGVGC
jgi:hypothetical protein